MRKFLRLLLPLAAVVLACMPAAAAPPDAVLRITLQSGQRMGMGSGTVIQTGEGRSYILTCAHLWEGLSEPRIVLDLPAVSGRQQTEAAIRVVRFDAAADLALLEVDAGPLPYAAVVAPAQHQVRARLLSIGYDKGTWPAVQASTSAVEIAPGWIYTSSRPVEGRSGGALLDANGYLLGVCHGYEVGGRGRGIYVGHDAILRFLGPTASPQARPRPPPQPCPS